MKFLGAQLSYFLGDRTVQRNVRSLLKYIAFLTAVVVLFSVLFHFIKLYEGEQHSWVTGFYWTLITMTTLGFGDIVFHSDLGRVFTIVVLMTGVVLLLIVLPFAFIQYFYAPFLEARLRNRAPRSVPAGMSGHVILCAYDSIAPGLIRRLEQDDVPYVVLEPDPEKAADLTLDGISAVTGDFDNEVTYDNLAVDRARMVVANRDDAVNATIILTVHEQHPKTEVVAVSNVESSTDVLELVGAAHVLPLKQWLGEQLATRVNASHAALHPIGRYEDLLIAELPVHGTPLVGKTIRETQLRERAGVSVIGVWERGRLLPAGPDSRLHEASVLAVIGAEAQLDLLNEVLAIYDVNPNPVVVIGGGHVGRAVSQSLKRRGVPVHVVEREASNCGKASPVCTRVFRGDAADYDLLCEAGILEAPSVVVTTNDDATNVFLASYCRQLNPELRVVCRVTEERNIDTMHKAGADFVLSYASLGAEAVLSRLNGRALTLLAEGVDFFTLPTPRRLVGRTLAESEIGAATGLTVIALRENGHVNTQISASTPLVPGSSLVLLGDTEQRRQFEATFAAEA
ncbi:MAG: NAD-binding protein [Bacteroidota bacterium]